jgi:hypothetical protein
MFIKGIVSLLHRLEESLFSWKEAHEIPFNSFSPTFGREGAERKHMCMD